MCDGIERLGLLVQESDEQVLLRRKIAIERALADPSLLAHIIDGGIAVPPVAKRRQAASTSR